MDSDNERLISKFFVITILGIVGITLSACTVQWAIKNKNTDCGFTLEGKRSHERPENKDHVDITITQEGVCRPGTPNK